jgi:hypothetical protein
MTRKPKSKSKAVTTTNAKAAGPISHYLLQRIAVFGDSGFALLGSFFLLVLAMTVAWYTDDEASNDRLSSSDTQHHPTHSSLSEERSGNFDALYKKLGPVPEMRQARVFSIDRDSMEDIHAAYKEDGVVAMRGLIDPTLLERLDEVSKTLIEKESKKQHGSPTRRKKKRDKQFHTMQQSPIFLDFPDLAGKANNETESEKPTQSHPNPFLEVALLSKVPIFASQLMLPELKTGENVRMLR